MPLTANEKKRRLILMSVAGLTIACLIVFVAFTVLSPQKDQPTFKVGVVKTDAVTGKAGGAGTNEYNKKVEQYDGQQADKALLGGQSHVPTPTGKSTLVARRDASTPTTPAPPAPVRVQPVRTSGMDNGMGKRMLEDLADLNSQLTAANGQGAIVYLASEDNKRPASTTSATPSLLTSTPAPAVTLKPGDLLYAVIDTGVNSDVPSAVMATVVSGNYNKAKLLGKFQRFEERLVLAFNRIILPDGRDIQLEGFAIDPNTTEASVASSADTHFFSRWGGLVASAFLAGLGEAKRYSGAESPMYGNGMGMENSDRMVWSEYSLADQAWIAAGKVGEKAGSIFEKTFDRAPTVRLESGSPVGVLILNVKK